MKIVFLALALTISGALLPLCAFAVTIPLDNSAVSSPAAGKNTIGNGTNGIGYVDIEKVFNEHPLCKRSHEAFDAEAVKRKTELKTLENEIADFQRIIVSSTTQLDVLRSNLALLNKGIIPGTVQASSTTMAPPNPATIHALPGMQLQSSTITIAVQPSTTTAVSAPLVSSNTAYVITADTASMTPDFRALVMNVVDDIKRTTADIETMKTDVSVKKSHIAEKLKQNKQELCELETRQTDEVLQDINHIIGVIAKELNLTVILDRKDVLYGQPYQDLTDKVIERLLGR